MSARITSDGIDVGIDIPSCQPKLLSIVIFLPIRQPIATRVSKINVTFTPMMAGRKSSDMASDVVKFRESNDHGSNQPARRVVFICVLWILHIIFFELALSKQDVLRHGLRIGAYFPRVNAAVRYCSASDPLRPLAVSIVNELSRN